MGYCIDRDVSLKPESLQSPVIESKNVESIDPILRGINLVHQEYILWAISGVVCSSILRLVIDWV